MTLYKKNNIYFKHDGGSYAVRYYSIWLWIIGWFIVYPILIKGFSGFPNFIYGIFFKDWAIALVFLLIPVFWQIYVTYETSDRIKFMTLKSDLILIKFYGFFKEKSNKIYYNDISSLEHANDWVKSFIFTMKSGEKRIIRADILEKDKAFELIRQRINI